ncbi:MAG: hypothetical protein WCA79_13085 [Anaerolineales bacterium]
MPFPAGLGVGAGVPNSNKNAKADPERTQGRSLYLIRCEHGASIRLAGIPSRTIGLHLIAHEEQLPIGQSAQQHPLSRAHQIEGTIGIESHMLFEKSEQMLDGHTTNHFRKSPKIHAAQIGKRYALRSGPP